MKIAKMLEPTKLYVLLALANGPGNGADIRGQIIADTLGVYLRDSTLYDALKSMRSRGLIEPLPGKSYQLTEKGRRRLEMESRTMQRAA